MLEWEVFLLCIACMTCLTTNFIGEKMNLPFKRSKISICVGVIISTGYQANAAEDEIQEILVSSALRETVADQVHPVTILSGDELRQKVGNTLGDTLANEPGINIMSYGTGVGQPIIRGQTGNRVSVLQNSVGVKKGQK